MALMTCLSTFATAGSDSQESFTSPTKTALTIDWDTESLTLIQENGNYARIIRLNNGEMLCAYDLERKVWVRHSNDEGKTWQEPIMVAASPHGHLTNAELLQLKDGDVLCLYNERPDSAFGEWKDGTFLPTTDKEPRPFTIQVARSRDAGKAWQSPVTLYTGGYEFSSGCWEPTAIQLPSGEVQVFFANETPYRGTNQQEITLLRSLDGARTWRAPETAIFRKGFRDGMPSPLVLNNGKGIVVAIEDNGLHGTCKPVIVYMDIEENWRSGAVGGSSPKRRRALSQPLDAHIYAGAPYIRQIPHGETVLSFQQSETGEVEGSRMVVCIGDSDARKFGSPTYPFPQGPGTSQLWNSLFIKNERTVTAVSTTKIKGTWGVWSIDGYIRQQLSAK